MLIKHYALWMAHCQNVCAIFDLDLWPSDQDLGQGVIEFKVTDRWTCGPYIP